MTTTQIDPIDLKALIDQDKVKVIDGSWALDGSDMRAAFDGAHIPGAVFFDIDAISDRSVPLPHMAPSIATFAEAVGAMGISADDHIVVYDRQGLFSAARVWWTFRLMGHETIQVLRGGLPAWQAAGLPVAAGTTPVRPVPYTPQPGADIVIDINDLRESLNTDAVVLDARPAARFAGAAPEPRAGLRSGHMPGARSLPFSDLIRDGALKPQTELETIFAGLGLGDGAVITTCGSGVTAAIISLALAETGRASKLYDGSWAQWGQDTLDTPVMTGAD